MLCENCKKKEVPQKDNGRKRKYCSDQCKFDARNKMRSNVKVRVKCAWRECKFTVAHGNNGRQPKYCSPRCKQLYYRWQKEQQRGH